MAAIQIVFGKFYKTILTFVVITVISVKNDASVTRGRHTAIDCLQKMAQFKLLQRTKWRSLFEVLEVSDLVDIKFNICPGYPPKITYLKKQEACAILY